MQRPRGSGAFCCAWKLVNELNFGRDCRRFSARKSVDNLQTICGRICAQVPFRGMKKPPEYRGFSSKVAERMGFEPHHNALKPYCLPGVGVLLDNSLDNLTPKAA